MDRSDKIEFKVFGPLAGMMALLVVCALAALLIGANQADLAAQRREEQLVDNGMAAKMREIEHSVVGQAVWDDAVRNLDLRFDPAWADANIGQFLSSTWGFDKAFVIDAEGRPLYAMKNAVSTAPNAYDEIRRPAQSVIAKVRRAEAARGPFKTRGPSKEMIAKPIQASEIVSAGGEVAILTATLVQPDFGTAYPAHAAAPIVITTESIDAAFVENLAARFLLKDAHRSDTADASDRRQAHSPLKDAAGHTVALLAWTPNRPGAGLLAKALPVLALAIVTLAALGLFQFNRGRRAAKSLVASEARAKHMARHDALTGLPNRTLFTERLNAAVALHQGGAGEVAVICIDLDRFKEVNDSLGHQAGDELIIETARRLRSVCRGGETVARLGGDEFAIVLDADLPRAVALAGRLLEVLGAPAQLGGTEVFVGASIGVTVLDGEVGDGAELLRRADVALYRAKDQGRGQVSLFEPDMDAALKARRATERDLRSALANGELRMVYQPQVGAGGKVFGVEALIRWDHPERGAISPACFIPIAEECGLIEEIGLFTLRRAFEDSRLWPDLKVAVNVSARQLTSATFLDALAGILTETGARADRIELEITEGLLLGDDPQTHQTLQTLRDTGFTLALDDFGTGYSSLAYLSRFPIDKIKIDRSFVSNLGIDAEADAVVKAIIKLARALNLSIIAEGVETIDQRERLVAAGCSSAQGFLFSEPVRAEEIASVLGTSRLRAA